MVKLYGPKRRKIFDDDADWLPPRNRKFVLKNPVAQTRAPEAPEAKKEAAPALPPKGVPGTKESNGQAVGVPPTDKQGLERAYAQGDTYIWGDTLYIAGSHTPQDWFDDLTKVPFWGDLRGAERYQAAEKALKENPNVKRVVGHSLGGSVALELQKNYKGLESRTYGAPVWDPFGEDRRIYGKVDRFRNLADPFSFFDGSANNSIKWDPFTSWSFTHAYDNIANLFTADKSTPPPDGQKAMWQPWNYATPVSTDPSP